MNLLSFTPTVQNALRELDRLEGIKNRLSGLVVDIKATNPDSLFIGLYEDRLKMNVLPAIKQVKKYLLSQDALVTKESN